MLCAAEADSFASEGDCVGGMLGCIGVGPYAQLAVSSAHAMNVPKSPVIVAGSVSSSHCRPGQGYHRW